MRVYVKNQLCHFKHSDFVSYALVRKIVILFFAWALPAYLFVLWSSLQPSEIALYTKAIEEGKGPHLWNVIGSFALFLSGITLAFPGNSTMQFVLREMLFSTYVIGALSFGIILGEWSLLITNDALTLMERGIFGVLSIALLLAVFIYNACMGYLGALINTSFLIKISHIHSIVRIPLGLSVSALIAILFLNWT